jgi:N-acetylmuramoyl-L-alanine amidase
MKSKIIILTAFLVMWLFPCSHGLFELFAKEKSLTLKTVVIDAGHGGHDPGGVSTDRKTYEKNLTLDIAKRLGQKIKEKYPDVKVVYTRTTDVYVTLNDRATIANKNNADLFISVHTNASTSTSAHGTSVHVLGQSSRPDRDLYAGNLNVCKRENSVILLEEDYSTTYQGFDPNSPESFILFNLMSSSHFENSIVFAEHVDREMRKSQFTISGYTGIHQDPFWVLWKTSMPAVLLEMGFITNAADLKILKSEEGREEIASKLLNAFSSYKAYYDGSADTKQGAPVPVTAPAGTYYGIQIFGLKKELPAGSPEFKGLDTHIVRSEGSTINRYVTGKWDTSAKAISNLESVRAKFPDAYVVKVSGGTVIRVK